MHRILHTSLYVLLVWAVPSHAQPVVLKGAMLEKLLGTPIRSLRLIDARGTPIVFQVDEVTPEGDYICRHGEAPNAEAANGLLDSLDEISFLYRDMGKAGDIEVAPAGTGKRVEIALHRGAERRVAYLVLDSTAPRAGSTYISYDHETSLLETPWFYARFAPGRFHFVRAGIRLFADSSYIDLTNELRVRLFLRALWGLVPISYSEENIVCRVRRYTVGPVRLIRVGDFHLALGLWLKASRARVTMVCYPRLVKVPVRVHVPVRFSYLFQTAYIEMTPVISRPGSSYVFSVPECGFSLSMPEYERIDAFRAVLPADTVWFFTDRRKGFGWLLRTSIPDSRLFGHSGFIVRKPTPRNGIGHVGYRLALRDCPRGRYDITNWVGFSRESHREMREMFDAIMRADSMSIDGKKGFFNALAHEPGSSAR